jgi:RNA polymerase sigma-70 factor (ECF subfamily)
MTQAGIPDEEIVRRVLAGDTAVFEILVRRYNQRLYRAAYAIVREPSEAEDVMQEAYVRAYEHLAQFEGRSSFATWLTRIAIYEALGRLRARRKLESREDLESTGDSSMRTWAANGRSPEEEASGAELRAALERAIDELPDLYRHVFVLRAVEGMSGIETAACLGIQEETVKTRLHRARGLLRRKLFRQVATAKTGVYAFLGERCDRVTAAIMSRIAANPLYFPMPR